MNARAATLALALALGGSAAAHDRLWSVFEAGSSLISPNTGVERNGAGGATVPDVDGDGVPEVAVGWPGPGVARVDLRSGANGSVLWSLDGFASNAAHIGIAIVTVRDLDLDGIADLAVGTEGSVLLVSSASGAELRRIFSSSPLGSYRYGSSLAAVGDQDGDGFDELLIGDPQSSCFGAGDHYTCTSAGPGHAELRSTRDGALLAAIPAPAGASYWGASAARFPDVVGDARPEYALEAFVPGSGWVLQVLSGTGAQPVAQVSTADSSLQPRLRAALAPDLDGDGREELLLLEAASVLRVLSGGTGAELWRHAVSDLLAWDVEPVGDRDGDGLVDIALGVDQRPYCYLGCSHEGPGYVEILSGRDGSVLEQLVGTRVDDRFGTALGSLGDLDGDGLAELWVASPSALEAGVPGRRIEVVAGAPELSRPRVYCEPYAPAAGASVGSAGSTSVSQNQLALTLTGAPPGALGVLVFGAEASATSFGCVAPPLHRVVARVADASGAAQARLDLARWTAGPTDPLVPGTTWSFAWFLRPAATASAGWSSALRATFVP